VGWRNKTEVDEVVESRPPAPDADTELRDETDPDPLIEEMVARLRDGLSTLTAIDEWGRPIAWRNVVRLALGPLANKLRDTEQALELAVSMLPPSSEATTETDAVSTPEPVAEAAPQEESLPLHEETVQAQVRTVEVILPAAESRPETPLDDVQGHGAPEAPQASAASPFVRSGDQRAVPVRSLSPRELLSGGGAYDAASPQYDRFLTGLNGQGQQVRGDQHRGTGRPGLGHNL
jgi:hypothetical protein